MPHVWPAAALLLLLDISGTASRLNPGSARFGRPVDVAPDAWSNWDMSFDGSTLGATRGDEKVIFYDTATGRELVSIDTEGHSIHDTAISGDGRHYALTLDGGTVQIFSRDEKKKIGEFKVSAGFC